MRLGTFNLLNGRSVVSGRVVEAELRAAAGRLDADVVGLQEVDRSQPRSGGLDQAAFVAAALEAPHWRFVAALAGTPGQRPRPATGEDGTLLDGPTYGVALVSRLPVRSWHVRRFRPAPVGLPLMMPGSGRLRYADDEPRVALGAVLETIAGPLTVVTAHLSFVPGWNVAQLRALAAWTRRLPAPRVLLGDFNLPGALPRLVTGWPAGARVATYPSWHPRVQLDHILLDGLPSSAVARARSLRLPVSDHCALVADLTPTGRTP